MDTAFITHKVFLKHVMGEEHPECPERLSNLCDRLLMSHMGAFINWIDNPPQATTAQLLRAHDSAYLEHLKRSSPQEGIVQVDGDTTMNPYTLTAAYHAAGAAIMAVDMVMGKQARNAFCAVRPPGHHATRQQTMGFCFFNNVAVAAYHAIEAYSVKRVAIVDFDVHHGNGTEDIVANDERILMLSTFEYPLYPYSGDRPLGLNMVNVPIPRYGKGEHLMNAVIDQWEPALESFHPQLILVSAGYDAHQEDEMSSTRWSDKDYAWLSRRLLHYANSYADGRIIAVLEGGYHIHATTRNALDFISAMME